MNVHTDLESMTVPAELEPGASLGGYSVERVVGRGGSSVVYSAHDTRLGRRVALKVLNLAAEERRSPQRYLRESRLAASIDHPNVIPVYEAGETDDGAVFIAMRLVRGVDLATLIDREGPLEPSRAVAICDQVASALDAAHAAGLLHLDVKPRNVLLSEADDGTESHVYLSDFGLARATDERFPATSFRGTPKYAAPEQVDGHPGRESDIYALGCVLFECLTGQPPFDKDTMLGTLWSHLYDAAPQASALNPRLPRQVDDVLQQALAKDPGERPPTSAELVVRVRAALGLQSRRNIRARAAAGILAVAVATLIGVVYIGAAGRGVHGATITSFAGTGEEAATGDGGPAREASLARPVHIAADQRGAVYFSEESTGRVRRIDSKGIISTLPVGRWRSPAQDAPAFVGAPQLATDGKGRLYVLDVEHPTIWRIDRGGRTTRLAGTGTPGILDDGSVTHSRDLCSRPAGIAVDSSNRVFVACGNANRVIRLDGPNRFTVVAGNGNAGDAGDGGLAVDAELNRPIDLAFTRDGSLLVADFLNNRIRRVDPNGVITTVAGTGNAGLSSDGWQATSVDLWLPSAVATDRRGNVYVVESATSRIRKIDTAGRIGTVAGTGTPGFGGDGGIATDALLAVPTDVAIDGNGNLYIADRDNNRIRKVSS